MPYIVSVVLAVIYYIITLAFIVKGRAPDAGPNFHMKGLVAHRVLFIKLLNVTFECLKMPSY